MFFKRKSRIRGINILKIASVLFFFFFLTSPVYADCVPKILDKCPVTEYACSYKFQEYCCTDSVTQCISTGTPVPSLTKPIPPHNPTPLPCSAIGDPEFHSLRPYQASPCSTETASTAKFCGNDLTLHETVTVNYPGDEQYLVGTGCVTSGSTVTCNYSVPVEKEITLNLDVANLPIMGNTEDVPNSQPPTSTESLSDADKMNGYVSWYLNGVMSRAEDGNTKNSDSKNIIDFSGPINKLLPSAILDAQRLDSINATKITNHNQIVVCADPDNGGFWGGLLDVFGLGKYSAKPCYNADGSPSSGRQKLRLENWEKDKLDFNIGANTAIKIWLAGVKLIFPGAADAIEKSVGDHWTYAKPPLPWDNGKGKAFETEAEYQKAYQEWKGNVCVIIPLINKVVCINNIFVPSYYADLYSYVPLSSTEDLQGKIEIENPPAVTSYSANGIDVSGISFNTNKPSILFFPHMQESTDLADSLQDTFVSKGEKGNKTGASTNVAAPASCTTVEVRSNKGDSLFATNLVGTLNYTAAFSCKFDVISTCSGSCNLPNEHECRYPGGVAGTGSCVNGRFCCNLPGATPTPPPPPQTCEKEVDINLSTLSYTPKVEDIWSQLVAGPQSIFKRIFPKTNTPGSVGQIKDMPGSTTITYSGDGVKSTADLKFPHIGSIGEYFLKGIQTALRPKGFGEPISFDLISSLTATDSTGVSTNICSSQCNSTPTQVNMTGVEGNFIMLANEWLGVPGNPRIDMYKTVVDTSIAKGVDPIFTLAIWLHETGASNYKGICTKFGNNDPTSGYCQKVLDFGINDPSIVTTFKSDGTVVNDHLLDQLKAFVELPNYYISKCGQINKCNIETFGAMFRDGQCQATSGGNAYIASIKNIYNWLAPSQTFPCYPIKIQ